MSIFHNGKPRTFFIDMLKTMMYTRLREPLMALSKEEKESFRVQFLEELDKEHLEREERARRKRERRHSVQQQENHKNKEIRQLQSEIRRKFYESNGYRLEKDPTGRDMWLSPAEQENKSVRRQGRKKKKKSSKKQEAQKQSFIMYAIVIALAIIIGMFITR